MKSPTLLAGAALAFSLAASDASANVYDINIQASAANLACTAAGGKSICRENLFFAEPLTVNANDQFNIDVLFDSPVQTQAAKTESIAFVALFDAHTSTFGGPGTDSASSTLNLLGYKGPAGALSGPFTITQDSYVGAGGLFAKSSGFSFTGFDSTLNILSSDPNGVLGVSIGTFAVGVPEPATWAMMLTGFAGLGGALRSVRRRRASAQLA